MRTARGFVLAMSDQLHELGIERALFDCHLRHAPFYRCLGFAILDGAGRFRVPLSKWQGCTMSFDYTAIWARSQIIKEMPKLLNRQAA